MLEKCATPRESTVLKIFDGSGSAVAVTAGEPVAATTGADFFL